MPKTPTLFSNPRFQEEPFDYKGIHFESHPRKAEKYADDDHRRQGSSSMRNSNRHDADRRERTDRGRGRYHEPEQDMDIRDAVEEEELEDLAQVKYESPNDGGQEFRVRKRDYNSDVRSNTGRSRPSRGGGYVPRASRGSYIPRGR